MKHFSLVLLTLALCAGCKGNSQPASEASETPAAEAAPAPVPQPAAPVGEEVTTPSGLKYQDIVVGTGATPQQGDLCVMHYVGTLEDGKKFDSSYDHGRPFEYHFGVDGVIEGWREGVSTMKAGGKRKLVIPSHIGYGASGSPPVIPPNATLIFEVELLEVRHGQ